MNDCIKCGKKIPNITTWFGRQGYCSRPCYFIDYPTEQVIEKFLLKEIERELNTRKEVV